MAGTVDRLRRRLFGRAERAWAGSVEDLLFDGESVKRRVPVGDNRVVVTTHRLLAFTPTADGENYRQVDLPNVADVRPGYRGEDHLLPYAVQLVLFGLLLAGLGLLVDFDAFVPTDVMAGTGEAAGQIGMGGIIGMMQTALDLVAALDDVSLVLGAGLFVFGLFVVAVYLLTRERAVVVAVAGDAADIPVPTGGDGDAEAAAADLEVVLFDPAGSAAGPADESHGSPGDSRDPGGSDDGSGADAGFKSDDPL